MDRRIQEGQKPQPLTFKENQKPYYRTKAEIVLLEDVQDFRQDGLSEEDIKTAFERVIEALG